MASDWWFLAMIGSAASAVGGALGTAATGALSTLGHLAGSAASGIGTAATGALNAVTGGGGAGAGGAASAAPAAATAGGGAGGVIPASEVASAGPAASTAPAVSTANLPAASGGQTIASTPASATPMSTPTPVDSAMGQLFGSSQIGKVSAAPGGTSAYGSSALPTSSGPEGVGMGNWSGPGGAGPAPPPGGYMGSGTPPPSGGILAQLPKFASQVGTGLENSFLQRIGVTNPNMGWGDIAKQAGLSQIAGGPFFGYNPQASFLSNLANAGGQRVLSSLFPGGGGQRPQSVEQAITMMLANQNQNARQLPVYGSLPGYG